MSKSTSNPKRACTICSGMMVLSIDDQVVFSVKVPEGYGVELNLL